MSDASTEADIASHGVPEPAVARHGELRHTLTVHDVEAALVAAGVPRSHRQVIRYCETKLLDAVKVPGPTGAQWFVSPASLPKAIGDLKQWEAQRAGHGVSQLNMSDPVTLEEPRNNNSDTARHGTLEPAMSDKETSQKGSVAEPAMARHGMTELDIYEHPYVKRLEERNEKLEAKYEAQVRRTEEIQLKSQAQLVELQRMTAVGQSETLADFMLKAKDWMLGRATEPDRKEEDDMTP